MISGLLEVLNDQPFLLVLMVVGTACIGGGIPPIIERLRRRNLENALPSVLESLSDSIGAGEGLEKALFTVSETREDLFGKLLSDALATSQATSFDATLSKFAFETRSKQVQRIIHLLLTATQNDAPLQDILYRMSIEYEDLNKLLNRRETDLQGSAMLIILFIAIGLPVLIAFVVGLFAPKSAGFQVGPLNSSLTMFFGFATAVSVAVSGRMLGRFRDYAWIIPIWMFLSMILYILPYNAIGS